jgi:hypothetical protein
MNNLGSQKVRPIDSLLTPGSFRPLSSKIVAHAFCPFLPLRHLFSLLSFLLALSSDRRLGPIHPQALPLQRTNRDCRLPRAHQRVDSRSSRLRYVFPCCFHASHSPTSISFWRLTHPLLLLFRSLFSLSDPLATVIGDPVTRPAFFPSSRRRKRQSSSQAPRSGRRHQPRQSLARSALPLSLISSCVLSC